MLEAMICKSCGAPLTSSKCEYCGTVYRGFEEETVTFYCDNQPVLTATKADSIMSPNEMRAKIGLKPMRDREYISLDGM